MHGKSFMNSTLLCIPVEKFHDSNNALLIPVEFKMYRRKSFAIMTEFTKFTNLFPLITFPIYGTSQCVKYKDDQFKTGTGPTCFHSIPFKVLQLPLLWHFSISYMSLLFHHHFHVHYCYMYVMLEGLSKIITQNMLPTMWPQKTKQTR